MVPANSYRISRVPHYSGYCLRLTTLRVQDYHFLWFDFPDNSTCVVNHIFAVLQPHNCQNNYGLGYSPFDRHYLGNHFCFLFLRLLRCFSSPGWLSVCTEWHCFTMPGCPIRISKDQRLFAPPLSFSQLITSFIASESQGIPRTLLFTSFYTLCFLLTLIS